MLKLRCFTNNVLFPAVHKSLFSYEAQEILPRVSHLKSELYEKLIMLQPNSPDNSKVLKISVLGCPNSGKSSLVNMLTRWDTCAVSGKVNTTRNKQTAILTQDNVQLSRFDGVILCFMDLPGIIAKRKGFNFKLEKSLIRDPHVGVFESDLIICVVDVTHKSSQTEMHMELLKALHFFKDKPAILVLNKIDKIKKKMKLLDITKRLTEGVVGGKISHFDSYANRFKKTVPTFPELLEDEKFSKLLLKHTKTLQMEDGDFSSHIKSITSDVAVESRDSFDDEMQTVVQKMVPELLEDEKSSNLLLKHTSTPQMEDGDPNRYIKSIISDIAVEPRDSSDDDMQNIVTNVSSSNDAVVNMMESEKDDNIYPIDLIDNSQLIESKNEDAEDQKFLDVLYKSDPTNPLSKLDKDIDDPILDVLKKQLMIDSVSREEVMLRRAAWKEIGNYLEKSRETSWKHFDDVFAVSSVTGYGIEAFRQYLINRAKPGRWYFHSSLITDQEPESLVRMCILANCMDQLEKEIPYQIKIDIDNYEKCEDGSLHIHVILRCKTSRQLMTVLGERGSNISAIADKSRITLQKCFQTDVYLKLSAARRGIPGEHLRRMKSVTDYRKLFPNSSDTRTKFDRK